MMACALACSIKNSQAADSTWINLGVGDWLDQMNWDNGVPGADDRANFYQSDATVTALAGDLVVSQAMVNAAGMVAFDLGGSKLVVGERFDIGGNAMQGFPVAYDAQTTVHLVSGEFDFSGAELNFGSSEGSDVNCYRNEMVMDSGTSMRVKDIRIGLDNYRNYSRHDVNNLLAVIGPGTLLSSETIAVGVGGKSTDNVFLVQDAAVTNASLMNIAGGSETQNTRAVFRNSRIHNKGDVSFARGWGSDEAQMILDEGTAFDIDGGFMAGGSRTVNSRVVVKDSELNIAGYVNLVGNNEAEDFKFIIEGPGAIVNANGDYFALCDAYNSQVIVDRGALNIAGSYQMGTWNGYDLGLIISNGVVTAGAVLINTSNTEYPHSNYVEISGPDAALNTGAFTIGQSRGGPDNYLHVNGGTLAVSGAITIGNPDCSNNTLRVSAPTSKLTGSGMALENNASVVFDIPEEEGFANGVGGDAVMNFSGAVSMDSTTRVEINAGKFIGRARLMQAAAIDALPDANFTVNIAGGYSYKLIRESGRIEIACGSDGTFLLIR